jgi:hypothetical protein
MKLLMLTGALTGFIIALAAGWFQQVPWPTLLLRAILAAYVTSLLAGWWGRHWSRNLMLAHQNQPGVSTQNSAKPEPLKP